MKKQELLELLESWENLELITAEIMKQPEYMRLLIDIIIHSSNPKKWRAAWIAEKINDKIPGLLEPFMDILTESLKPETGSGIKRHILKLVSLHPIPEKHHSFLLNYCLECMTSAKEPVAVRVHAMQVLFNISEWLPEFKPELLAVIGHETDIHSSPGIKARGKKLALQLQKQIRKSGLRFT